MKCDSRLHILLFSTERILVDEGTYITAGSYERCCYGAVLYYTGATNGGTRGGDNKVGDTLLLWYNMP